MRVALVSDTDWRAGIVRERARGADLIGLAHLSFCPYVAASRDRAGLECAERAPSACVREAVTLAAGGWIAASAYESEGEGVFYATAYLAGPEVTVASSRQRVLEAGGGRYEPMFLSPGHEPVIPVAAPELPGGSAAVIVGADLRAPGVWASVGALGVSWVFGGASDGPATWPLTCRVAAGMAAAYGIGVLVANRADHGCAGGHVAVGPDGAALAADPQGHYGL